MNMSPKNKAHFQAKKEAIHLILTGIGDEIYSTLDACQTTQEIWEAIKRLQQDESLNIQDPKWSRFVTIVKQQNKLDEVSYHKLFDTLKQYQKEVNELRAERLARDANLLALVATAQANQDPYYQTSKSQKSYASSSKLSIPTRSHTTTRHKGKEIAKPITPPSKRDKDSDLEQAQRNNSLWEVIINGDSPAPTIVVDGVVQPVSHKSIDQKLARRNELKAHGTLLLAFPNKHQLKFNSHKDAKTLMEEIEKCFEGNTETKKVQKTLLKQQFENFTVSAATSVFAVCTKPPTSSHPNIDSLSNAVIYSFFVSQSTSPQLDNKDLKQINADDLEEMDLRWHMVMLTMRARRFLEKTGKNLGDNRVTSMGFDMSKVECYNCHIKGYFSKECRSPKDSRRSGATEPQKRTAPRRSLLTLLLWLLHHQALLLIMRYHLAQKLVQKRLESVEARLVVYKLNESILEENIKLLNVEVQARHTALVTLRQKLNQAEHERDDLKIKLDKFQSSSKNLTELLASQTNDKHGLGYFSSDSDFESLFPSSLFDRLQPSGGYHVVPPTITRNFMPPKLDLLFHIALFAVETEYSAFTVQLSSFTPTQAFKKVVEETQCFFWKPP
nr:hypothetical protein [Tanacetum cinerariifolium]